MIGLVDYDFQSAPSTHLRPPNVEIMKLATYYRAEENIFCRIIGLEETELVGYDKIYFFSESERPIEIPEQFKRANNIIFGGTYFTNTYQPFTNEIIDYTIPKIEIYKGILIDKYRAGVDEATLSHILDDAYYRNYAGDKKLPIPPMNYYKRIILYDKDFFYPDWKNTINDILKRKPSCIMRIHPIVCKKVNEYFELRAYNRIARSTEIILDIDIPLSETFYLLKKYKNMFLADITNQSNVFITLGGDFKYSKQYYDDMIYKLNILYTYWANGIPIKVKYQYPKAGYVNPIEHLSLLIEKWTKGQSKLNKTIEDKLPSDKLTLECIEFENVKLRDTDAIMLFRQSYNNLSKKGGWRQYEY